jgi:hypothetical protein
MDSINVQACGCPFEHPVSRKTKNNRFISIAKRRTNSKIREKQELHKDRQTPIRFAVIPMLFQLK